MDVLLNKYDYTDSKKHSTWGQIVRFQSANATQDIEVGSRVPSIWANDILGFNQLHKTSYIVNYADPKGPGGQHGPNNYEVNFEKNEAPKICKWFMITVSQRTYKVKQVDLIFPLTIITCLLG